MVEVIKLPIPPPWKTPFFKAFSEQMLGGISFGSEVGPPGEDILGAILLFGEYHWGLLRESKGHHRAQGGPHLCGLASLGQGSVRSYVSQQMWRPSSAYSSMASRPSASAFPRARPLLKDHQVGVGGRMGDKLERPLSDAAPRRRGRGRRSKCQNHAAQPVFGFWRRRHRTAWARCALLATCPITLPRGGRIWGCPEGLPSRPPFWCCLKFQPVQPGGGRGCKSRSEGLPRVPRPFRGTTSHSVSSSVYTLHRVCE